MSWHPPVVIFSNIRRRTHQLSQACRPREHTILTLYGTLRLRNWDITSATNKYWKRLNAISLTGKTNAFCDVRLSDVFAIDSQDEPKSIIAILGSQGPRGRRHHSTEHMTSKSQPAAALAQLRTQTLPHERRVNIEAPVVCLEWDVWAWGRHRRIRWMRRPRRGGAAVRRHGPWHAACDVRMNTYCLMRNIR